MKKKVEIIVVTFYVLFSMLAYYSVWITIDYLQGFEIFIDELLWKSALFGFLQVPLPLFFIYLWKKKNRN